MKRAIIVLLIIAGIGAGVGAYYIRRGGNEPTVNTLPLTRGDIVDAVASTGTLQAVVSVTVGSQVSGNIAWLGADFNSIVRKNQVIAKLDPTLFEAQVAQAKANLTNAKSQVAKDQVNLAYLKLTHQRNIELRQRGIITQDALDAAKAAVDQMAAQIEVDKASIEQAEAQLSQSQTNLDHTIIASPIDGIVTQRSVDVGQTVAASMTAPQLFIIAADLTKMQVSANIDEADVGRVRPGQPVTFRVDAYPGDEFQGMVSQIRLNPVVVNNVTTYATIINVPNDDFRLKPGMTANLKVQIARRPDVLRVPNAALRFRPNAEMFAVLNQEVPPELAGGRGGRGGQGGGGRAASAQSGVAAAAGPGGGDDRAARQMERFKGLSPDEQKQFLARLKGRGQDTGPFEKAMAGAAAGKDGAAKKAAAAPNASASARAAFTPKYGGSQSAQTIDALFAPVPVVETQGRVWVFMNKQLKPVRVRLGITDATYTEVIGAELPAGTEVVTGFLVRTARAAAGAGGNPLLPNQGRGGFPGGPPGRGR